MSKWEFARMALFALAISTAIVGVFVGVAVVGSMADRSWVAPKP